MKFFSLLAAGLLAFQLQSSFADAPVDTFRVTSFPDTILCKVGPSSPKQLLMKILSHPDTLITFNSVITASIPGYGSHDFSLTKTPAESTDALIESYHANGSLPFPNLNSFTLHTTGIEYVLTVGAATYYLQPAQVYMNTQTALPESVRMIINTTSFLADPVAPGTGITGLTFSEDTVYGLNTGQQPQTLVIKNSTSQNITIDSVRILTHNFTLALGYKTPGSGYTALAFGDSSSFRNTLQPSSWNIHAQDSLVTMDYGVDACFCLLKPGMAKASILDPIVLTVSYFSGVESKNIIFIVKEVSTGLVNRPSIPVKAERILSHSPSPFSSSLTINAPGGQPNGRLSIYNAQGTLVKQFTHVGPNGITWTPGNIPNGLYVIKYASQGKLYSEGVILLK